MSYRALHFPRPVLPAGASELRREVRAFVAGEIASGSFRPRCDNWLAGYDPDFLNSSRRDLFDDVVEDRLVRDRYELLRARMRDGTKPSAGATGEDQALHPSTK